jgi:hypothetical protein
MYTMPNAKTSSISLLSPLLAFVAIAGCATSHVMIGRARPPISPDQVQIYLHPPSTNYEEIALLDTSSKGSFSITAQGKTNAVIDRLKAEAAKLGANGILLSGRRRADGGIGGDGGGAAAGHFVDSGAILATL